MWSTVCASNNDSSIVIHLYFWFFSFSRLSTKPGSVPSILKSHSFTAATEFLASNTVWRFRQGVRLYYQTMMMSSMEDYQVSSVQVCSRSAHLTSFHSKPWRVWLNHVLFPNNFNDQSLKEFFIKQFLKGFSGWINTFYTTFSIVYQWPE